MEKPTPSSSSTSSSSPSGKPSSKCPVCKKPIESNLGTVGVKINERQKRYHKQCFKCVNKECTNKIGRKTFFIWKGQLCCENHYQLALEKKASIKKSKARVERTPSQFERMVEEIEPEPIAPIQEPETPTIATNRKHGPPVPSEDRASPTSVTNRPMRVQQLIDVLGLAKVVESEAVDLDDFVAAKGRRSSADDLLGVINKAKNEDNDSTSKNPKVLSRKQSRNDRRRSSFAPGTIQRVTSFGNLDFFMMGIGQEYNMAPGSFTNQIMKKWEQSMNHLGSVNDLPRLLNRIEIESADGTRVYHPSDISATSQSPKKVLRNFMESLCIHLGDTQDTLRALIEHWQDSPDVENIRDLISYFHLFLSSHMKETSLTYKVLKCLNRHMLLSPYMHLQNKFKQEGVPFKDVGSTWKLVMVIGIGDGTRSDVIRIAHFKGAVSLDESDTCSFAFIWKLAMVFERDMSAIRSVHLTIPHVHYGENITRDLRERLDALFQWYTETHEDVTEALRPRTLSSADEQRFVAELIGPHQSLLFFQWGTQLAKGQELPFALAVSTYRLYIIGRQAHNRNTVAFETHLFHLHQIEIIDENTIVLTIREGMFDVPLDEQTYFSAASKRRSRIFPTARSSIPGLAALITQSDSPSPFAAAVANESKIFSDPNRLNELMGNTQNSKDHSNNSLNNSDPVHSNNSGDSTTSSQDKSSDAGKDSSTLTIKESSITFSLPRAANRVVPIIVDARKVIAQCLPQEFKLKVVDRQKPPQEEPPATKPVPQPIVNPGFVETYKAFCNLYKRPISKSFVSFADNLIRSQIRELHLYKCPGLEPNQALTFDLAPVAATLRYSTFFRDFVVLDSARKDCVVRLATALRHNSKTRRLVLSGLLAEEGFQELGLALKANGRSEIMELDLSRNLMRDKGVMAVVQCIPSLRWLTHLDLSDCQMTSVGCEALMQSLRGSDRVTAILLRLQLSKNTIGAGSGSAAIAQWLTPQLRPEEPWYVPKMSLSELFLANCQVECGEICRAITESPCRNTLHQLDLSSNKIASKTALSALCQMLENLDCLDCIDVSGCQLSPTGPAAIIKTISGNSKLRQFSLICNNNNTGSIGAVSIAEAFTGNKNIAELQIGENNLKDEGLTTVLKCILAAPNCVRRLNISRNIRGVKGSSTPEFINSLVDVIRTFNLSDLDISEMHLGRDIIPALQAVGLNQSLISFNFSGNACGDPGIATMVASLLQNKTLKRLYCDGNRVTSEGYEDFLQMLLVNPTLNEISIPHRDIRRSAKEAKDSKEKEKLREVATNIQLALLKNRPKLTSVKDLGVAHDQNPEYRETMEDETVTIDEIFGKHSGYFAVYDGHGGRRTVDFVSRWLHENFTSQCISLFQENRGIGDLSTEQVMECWRQSFKVTGEEIEAVPITKSGSTAACVFIRKDSQGNRWVHAANIGDARSILCRGGISLASTENTSSCPVTVPKSTVRLAYEHRAADPDEAQRIIDAGGNIFRDRVDGMLAVARAFGDIGYKEFGVITDPYVFSEQLLPTDTHIVIGCDGLWDVLDDQEVQDLLLSWSDCSAAQQANQLLQRAIEKESTDNISVIVLQL